MKKYIIQLTILSVVLIVGCGTKSSTAIQEDNVKCEYYASEIDLYDPISILEKNNYLYVSNFHTSDYLISIIDEKELKIIGGVLLPGRGPLEATPPVNLQTYQADVIFHSRGSGKVFAVNERKPLDIREIYSFKSYVDQCIMTSDSLLIVSGNFKDCRFKVVNIKSDSVINSFGEYPSFWNEEKNISNSVKGIFHQTRFVINKNVLAAITNHTVELYDIQKNQTPKLFKQILIDKYSYIYSTDPKFIFADQDENTTRGVVSVAGDDQFIYLLFDNNKGADNGEIRHIKVYNWAGENVRIIRLNMNLSHICIDSRKEFIYGLTKEDLARIIRFEI